jgi:hypothetical protein
LQYAEVMLFPATIFFATIAYLPGAASATVVGRWAVLAVGSTVCLAFIRRPLVGWAHAWALALLLWAAVSVFWSVSPFDTIGESLHWLWLFVLFIVASQFRNAVAMVHALGFGLVASVPILLLQLMGFTPVVAADPLAGLFISRNTLGEISAVCLVWALARQVWVHVPATAFLVIASGSRGAWLAVVVGVLWFVERWWQRLAIVAAMVVVIVVWSFVRDSNDPLASAVARLDAWRLVLANLTLLGRGLETFASLAPQYEFVHNDTLQLVFELGIGSCLIVPIGFYAIRGREPETAALIALAGASLVSFPLHQPMGAALMATLSGFVVGAGYRAERAERISGLVAACRVDYERRTPAADLQHACVPGRAVAV